MKKKTFRIDAFVGLFFISILAVCMFFVLAAGARIYKEISAVMEEQYTSRTALAYITAKLHQSDRAGAVELGALGDAQALVIHETIEDTDYTTFVYWWDGYIMELFCPASESLLPTDGLRVIPADALSLTMDKNLVRVECATSAGTGEAYVALRSGGAA